MRKYLLCTLIILLASCRLQSSSDWVSVSTNSVNFEFRGGQATVNVRAITRWVVTPADSWVKTEVSDDSIMTLTVGVNPQNMPRSIDLIVRAGDAQQVIKVSQKSDMYGVPHQTLDSLALVALYHSTGGENWYFDPRMKRKPWDFDTPFHQWSGVTTELRSGQHRVISLDLSSLELVGVIPKELTDLTELSMLSLAGNLIEEIPFDILVKLKNLYLLDFRFNGFSGTIPDGFITLSQLRYLFIAGNDYTGTIPSSFSNFPNLKGLDISNNQLSGSFPSVLRHIPTLEELDLSANQFTGTIPDFISNLTSVKSLNLSGNRFSGTLPATMSLLPKLELLNLASNNFSGSFPTLTSTISYLQILNISDNGFTSLPDMSQWNALQYFDASFNKLTSLPASIGGLRSVTTLNLYGNKIVSIPESIGEMQALIEINLSENRITSLPESITRLSQLSRLLISSNQISSLPEAMGELKSLTWLIADDNKIKNLPSSIQNMYNALNIDLSKNQIEGNLPEWIGRMGKLESLNLRGNSLTGGIPLQILNAGKLKTLVVSDNMLSGMIHNVIKSDDRWVGTTEIIHPDYDPESTIFVKKPGVWNPKEYICPQRGEGFINCN